MKKAEILSEDMNRLIDATKDFIASPRSSREIYKYIQLKFNAEKQEVTATACDGYRLSVETAAVFEISEDFTVYIRPCRKFPKNTVVYISLEDEKAIILCNGNIFGCEQPEGEYLNYEDYMKEREVTFRIGFTPEYLIDAIKAAKATSTQIGSRNTIVLEFTGPNNPVYIMTRKKTGFRMVLPVRLPAEIDR